MTTYVYPKTLNNVAKYPAHILFTFFPNMGGIGDTIHLHMPANHIIDYQLTWENISILEMLKNAADWREKGGQAQNLPGGPGDPSRREAIHSLYTTVQTFISGASGVYTTAKAWTNSLPGFSVNKMMHQIFSGVGNRLFTFTFYFIPYTEQDTNDIRAIIKAFLYAAAPDISLGMEGNTKLPSILGYPSECQVAFYYNGAENKYLHRFKRCIIKGVDWDPTALGNFNLMRNGAPAYTKLQIQIEEMQFLTKQDITDNY